MINKTRGMSDNQKVLVGCGALAVLAVCCVGVVLLYRMITPGSSNKVAKATATPLLITQKTTTLPTGQSLSQPQPSLGAIPYQGVVKIFAFYQGEPMWSGSGTIVSADGLILTNAHVVLPEKYYPVDELRVGITIDEDQPPVVSYIAEVMQADPQLDLAVIRIAWDLNGNPIAPASLNLPTVPLGDSDAIHIGDPLTIIGYPTIGGETVTLTRGDVSGFTAEATFGERAFIKTSATIAGGNSGGLGADKNGVLIGVPTQMGYGGEEAYVDCRRLADTNRDGVIDENDNCVPGGGFINALRPVNLAKPLIEAAKRGEKMVGTSEVSQGEVQPGGEVLFQDSFSNPNSGWDSFTGEIGSTFYKNGSYLIEVNKPNSYVWGNPYLSFDDIILRVTAQPLRSVGDADYGVICRYRDEKNFYALEISEDGYSAIWKLVNGETQSLVDWQFSEAIPTDGSAVVISAGCAGDGLVLAVNGTVVASTTDNTFKSGDVGLIAGTWDTGGLTMGFDDFEVFLFVP